MWLLGREPHLGPTRGASLATKVFSERHTVRTRGLTCTIAADGRVSLDVLVANTGSRLAALPYTALVEIGTSRWSLMLDGAVEPQPSEAPFMVIDAGRGRSVRMTAQPRYQGDILPADPLGSEGRCALVWDLIGPPGDSLYETGPVQDQRPQRSDQAP